MAPLLTCAFALALPLCAYTTQRPPVHRFYDRPARYQLAAVLTMEAADAAQTCHNLANGGFEFKLPSQNCAADTAMLFGAAGLQELAAYALHRTGHHKLERYARLVTIGFNLSGLNYSVRHGAL